MTRQKIFTLLLVLGFVFFAGPVFAQSAEQRFQDFCGQQYLTSGSCAQDLCRLTCANGKNEEGCLQICLPKKCPDIPLDQCPEKFCAVMTECSKQKVCHYQMYGEKAKCGDLAYAGQDVDCCSGLVRRCGVEFFDSSCDMEGKNSVYNLPICIPCGDGICGNFENRCNCPEDCKNPTIDAENKPSPAEITPPARGGKAPSNSLPGKKKR